MRTLFLAVALMGAAALPAHAVTLEEAKAQADAEILACKLGLPNYCELIELTKGEPTSLSCRFDGFDPVVHFFSVALAPTRNFAQIGDGVAVFYEFRTTGPTEWESEGKRYSASLMPGDTKLAITDLATGDTQTFSGQGCDLK